MGWGTERAGAAYLAQLRLAEPVVVEYGQRFILRSENAARTLGGGVVLRFGPRRMRRPFLAAADALPALLDDDGATRLEQVLRLAGFERPGELALSAASGIPPHDIHSMLADLERSGRLIAPADGFASVPSATLHGLFARAEAWLERFHRARPEEPGCPIDRLQGWLESKSDKGLGRPLLERMSAQDRIKIIGRFVCLKSFAPALSVQDEKILAEMVSELEAAGFQPPAPGQLRAARSADAKRLERLLKVASAHGALVRIDSDLFLASAAEQRLREVIRAMIDSGEEVTVASVREKLGSSRKYVVPFLEHLDRAGFTRRVGDARVLQV